MDGRWDDREGFLEHIAHRRTVMAEGSVEVHDELCDGIRYADRHTVHVTKKDGTAVREFGADHLLPAVGCGLLQVDIAPFAQAGHQFAGSLAGDLQLAADVGDGRVAAAGEPAQIRLRLPGGSAGTSFAADDLLVQPLPC